MLIVNADDFGRTAPETDAAAACIGEGCVTSVTAMVFMQDSERASELGRRCEVGIGLHLNFVEPFSGSVALGLREQQRRLCRFLSVHRYAMLVYNPWLREVFREVFTLQLEEFIRLYGREPTHFDGHRHKHLCANLLLDGIIPSGSRIRRNFSFAAGEKSRLNRFYRSWVDRQLERRYQVTDHFFSLAQCLARGQMTRVYALAGECNVELMTHPIRHEERAYLLGERHSTRAAQVKVGSYGAVFV